MVAKTLFAIAVALTIGAAPVAAFQYQSDPPPGSIKCGQRVTVKSSKACRGRPATLIGGCNIDSAGRQVSGAKRKVVCR